MDELEILEKLAAIGGEHHDAYVEELRKFKACKHPGNMMQQFIECCLACGYNVWYGPDPEIYLNRALKADAEQATRDFPPPLSPPFPFKIGEFKPCVREVAGLGIISVILKDTTIVWQPWGPYKGHAVDLGYDSEGNLQGIRIWDKVVKKT